MKKILFYIIFILLTYNLFSEGSMNVLVVPFENNSANKDDNVYSKLIIETVISDLTRVPRKIKAEEFQKEILSKIENEEIKKTLLSYYEPDILTRYYALDENITDVNLEIVKDIFESIKYKKFIPMSLNDLNITEKVDDYSRIFDVILGSTRELVDKMYEDISSYPPDINRILREKQSRIIAGDIKETFLFFNVGLNYLGTGLSSISNNDPEKYDLSSTVNSYMNGISPAFKIEIYRNYKNKYYIKKYFFHSFIHSHFQPIPILNCP